MTLKTIVIVGVGAALSACGSTPPELPPPPPAINIHQCTAPTGMTAPERQPLRPLGDYTQADVALYITELHHWATRGWLKLSRVREHADQCAHSAGGDDNDKGDKRGTD